MAERELKVRLSADAQRFRSGMRGAKSSFLSLKAAVAAGGAAIAAGIALSTREAIEFESAMAGVAKTVDASDAEIQRLGDRFQDLSERIPVSANELAGLGQVAGQLGVETSKIEGFVETTAKLSTAVDGLSGEAAATQLARFANVAGTSQDQFENLASSLVALGNNVEANEAEILNFAQNVVAAGRQVNLTEGEILGLSAAMVGLGANAEAGGTALQRTFIGMQDAVRSGGDELEAFAATAGMSTSEFARVFEQDASRAIQAFFAGIQRANESGASLTNVMEAMDLQSERTVRALLKAARASDQMNQRMNLGVDAFAENVALQKEAERRFDTTASKMQMLQNRTQNLATEIGEELLPAFVVTLEKANFLIGALQRLESVAGGADEALTGMAAIEAGLDAAVRQTGLLSDEAETLEARLKKARNELEGPARDEFVRSVLPIVKDLQEGLIDVDQAADEAGDVFQRLEGSQLDVSESSNQAGQSLDEYRERLQGIIGGSNTAAGATDALAGSVDGLSMSMDELFSKMVDRRTGPLPTQTDRLTGEALSENIVSDAEIERMRAGLGQAQEEVQDQAEEDMTELERLLKQGGIRAGEALIEGIILGGENLGDTLKRFIAKLASTFIMSQLTGALGIGSPSKRGMWVGEMLSEGLAVGIERRAPRVASASRNVAGRAERAMIRRGRAGGAGSVATQESGIVDAFARALREAPRPEWPNPEMQAAAEYEQRKVRRALEIAGADGYEPNFGDDNRRGDVRRGDRR